MAEITSADEPLPHFEKLGVFYLGREFDQESGEIDPDYLLYESKDLTTHAVCVGMTGSGKTGLCLSLLEEAAIDGIPAIAIDPKGDLGNLMLTFPGLQPEDFREWIDESAAARQGITPDEYAERTANLWREGLAEWDEDGARIDRFRDAVDIAIYTPGSTAGLPLTVLKSFNAPPPEVLNDLDAFRERIAAAAAGLLALLGIDADPIRSREHILLSNLFNHAWSSGDDLDIASLIHRIQVPPFEKIGILDLETFFPEKDRIKFSLSLNNLLASPTFAGWLEGDALDIGKLLYTEEGQPRLSIISIAHLGEAERMFFVTILLNEIVTWTRTQPGTSSLRAMLYMDEVFGYFPPVANPPTKKPMLTLLKQARAYGLGVVLATQNPVDLDYKGLSNTGTWFIGRLQTERDKARVLEGLEGASVQAGSAFDRGRMEQILAGLGKRVFLMNNVHDDHPVTFHTRWVLSYLRGPLTRSQIQRLMEPRKLERAAETRPPTQKVVAPVSVAKSASPSSGSHPLAKPPTVSTSITQRFLPLVLDPPDDAQLMYRAALIGEASLRFLRASLDLDESREQTWMTYLPEELNGPVWEEAFRLNEAGLEFESDPDPRAGYLDAPSGLSRKTSFSSWTRQLRDRLYREETLTLYECELLDAVSEPTETEGEFRIRLRHLAHEGRDLAVEKLRTKYASKTESLKKKIQTTEERLRREKAQYSKAGFSFGTTLLGAIFGRSRATSRGHVTRANKTWEQREDVQEVELQLLALQKEFRELEEEFASEVRAIENRFDVDNLTLDETAIKPRKSDLEIKPLPLLWTPWLLSGDGTLEPAFELQTFHVPTR